MDQNCSGFALGLSGPNWRRLPAAILFLFCLPLLLLASPAAAQPSPNRPEPQQQSAEGLLVRTMTNPQYRPKFFGRVTWIENGAAYLVLEPAPGFPEARDVVRHDTATGKRDVLLPAAKLVPSGASEPLDINGFSLSSNGRRVLIFTNTQRVWRMNTRGDYWVYDLDSGSLRKLGGNVPPSTLMFAKFSPDGAKVAYVHANNLYVEDLSTGSITQLTTDGSATIINGTSDWVSEEELDIRDGFRWSPDGLRIAFWQFNTSGVGQYTLIYDLGHPRGEIVTGIPYPNYGIYPQSLVYPYPEAGTTNSAVRVGVIAASGGPVTWVRTPGDPRENYLARMEWVGPNDLVLQHLSRLQNTNQVLLADATTGAVKQIFVDRDQDWVAYNHRIDWLDHDKQFLFLSERDGWRHLFRVDRANGKATLVTHGAFDVIRLDAVCPEENQVYFSASPDDPTQAYLYRTRLNGSGKAERVSPSQPGTHDYDISPDCRWAIHTFSTIDTPPAFDLVQLPAHNVVRSLLDNAAFAERVRPFTDGPTEFFHVDAGGGVKVDGWVMKPPHFDPSKKYPLIVNVYSEPAGQTTVDRWGSIFNRVLASDGYLVASFDNEGTPAPLGRAWRKAIYGSVGPLSSAQQAAALESFEREHSFVDPQRIGVWGWSGGGSETLNLMFRSPDLYDVGVAIASVPDQRLYDSIYQERYMGLPQDNPQGYEKGSAINFAAGLRGRLLVMHGTGDDNVHFQGFELLVNRLIELGKRFDMRVYPGRTHGLSEGRGTTLDVFKNVLWYFEDHLPRGPQSAAAN
jgi:dipeptidyl-peptidase-4